MSTDSTCLSPGAGRPACAVAGQPLHILRALIANNEALIEHYNGLLHGELEYPIAGQIEILRRSAAVTTQLNNRRDLFASLSSAPPPVLYTSKSTDAACSQPGTGRPSVEVAGEPSHAAAVPADPFFCPPASGNP